MNQFRLPATPDPRTPETATRTERVLRRKVPRDQHFLTWTRGWVSREGRLHTVFAARTLDYAVLTDDHLLFFTTGFFSRRPRRQVYAVPLDRLNTSEVQAKRGRHLRLWSRTHRPLLFEMRRNARSNTFADLLLHRTQREDSTPS